MNTNTSQKLSDELISLFDIYIKEQSQENDDLFNNKTDFLLNNLDLDNQKELLFFLKVVSQKIQDKQINYISTVKFNNKLLDYLNNSKNYKKIDVNIRMDILITFFELLSRNVYSHQEKVSLINVINANCNKEEKLIILINEINTLSNSKNIKSLNLNDYNKLNMIELTLDDNDIDHISKKLKDETKNNIARNLFYFINYIEENSNFINIINNVINNNQKQFLLSNQNIQYFYRDKINIDDNEILSYYKEKHNKSSKENHITVFDKKNNLTLNNLQENFLKYSLKEKIIVDNYHYIKNVFLEKIDIINTLKKEQKSIFDLLDYNISINNKTVLNNLFLLANCEVNNKNKKEIDNQLIIDYIDGIVKSISELMSSSIDNLENDNFIFEEINTNFNDDKFKSFVNKLIELGYDNESLYLINNYMSMRGAFTIECPNELEEKIEKKYSKSFWNIDFDDLIAIKEKINLKILTNNVNTNGDNSIENKENVKTFKI